MVDHRVLSVQLAWELLQTKEISVLKQRLCGLCVCMDVLLQVPPAAGAVGSRGDPTHDHGSL